MKTVMLTEVIRWGAAKFNLARRVREMRASRREHERPFMVAAAIFGSDSVVGVARAIDDDFLGMTVVVDHPRWSRQADRQRAVSQASKLLGVDLLANWDDDNRRVRLTKVTDSRGTGAATLAERAETAAELPVPRKDPLGAIVSEVLVLLEDAIENIDYPGADSREWIAKAKGHAATLAGLARQSAVIEQDEPSETKRSSAQPGLLHIKGESGTLCGVKNPSHVTDGVRYADCSACLAAVAEQGEDR